MQVLYIYAMKVKKIYENACSAESHTKKLMRRMENESNDFPSKESTLAPL